MCSCVVLIVVVAVVSLPEETLLTVNCASRLTVTVTILAAAKQPVAPSTCEIKFT